MAISAVELCRCPGGPCAGNHSQRAKFRGDSLAQRHGSIPEPWNVGLSLVRFCVPQGALFEMVFVPGTLQIFSSWLFQT